MRATVRARYRGGGGQGDLICLRRSPPTSWRRPPCAPMGPGAPGEPVMTGAHSSTCDAGTPALRRADTHWYSASAASVMGMDGQATAAGLLVRCLENEGVDARLRHPGRGEHPAARRHLDRSSDPVRAGPPRAGRVVHGRGLRPADRARRGVLGDARPRRDQPAARRRRRDHQLHAAVALSAQVGMNRSYKESHQGVDLVSMFAPVTKWSALVATPGAVPGDDPQGVQAGPDRAARRGLPRRSPRTSSEAPAARREPLPVNVPRARRAVPPAQVERAAAHAARGAQPDRAGRPRRRARRGGPGRCAASPRRWHPGGDHVPRQGRVPPTTTRWRSARSGSCATTTSTSASTDADLIIAVGYELQEFDPARINPDGDTKIIHIHRFPAEVDAHYDVAVGLHSDIGRSLDALAAAVGPPPRPARSSQVRALLAAELDRGRATTASRSRRPGSWPTPGRRCAARTSCWSTPAR